MPVRWRFLSDTARSSAADRDEVHERLMISLGIVADRQLHGVWGDAVVVVTSAGKACIDRHRSIGVEGQPLDAAVAIKQECAAVTGPVRSFEASLGYIGDAPIGGVDGDGFERAVENRLSGCLRRSCLGSTGRK